MHHAASIALVLTLAGTATAGEPAAPARGHAPACSGGLAPTRTAGALYINLATGERSLTLYGDGQPAEIDAVNTAALFDYWMSIDENPCWDDPRADGFGISIDVNNGCGFNPVVAWDYGDLPFDSVISGLLITVATTAIDDIDSNGDGTLDSGLDSVAVFYDGLSDGARSSNTPPTAVIRVEAIPGIGAADAGDPQIPDFDMVIDFGGTHFALGDSDGLNQGALYLPGAAPGRDVSAFITTCTTTSLGGVGTDCTLVPNPNADGLADFQYLQYYTRHDSNDKVTSISTFIGLGTPEGTVEISTYVTTTYDCSTSGGRFTTCSNTYTVTSTFFSPDSLPQGQSAFESFGIGSLGAGGDTTNIDSAIGGCCFWFGGIDCAGFLDQLVEEPQFNETYYNFIPYAQISAGMFTDQVDDTCLGFEFNGDGILDNGDIGAFIGLFLSKDPIADLNGDGILDNGDIGTFIELFLYCAG